MTTGWDGIPLALEALRDGAHDYLIKPFFSLAQVGLLVSQAARSSARQVTS
jgi:FixJ family two-component response regulator